MNDKLQALLQQQQCSFQDVYDTITNIDFTKAKLNQKSRVKLLQIVKGEVDSHPDNEATLNLLKTMSARRNFIQESANDNFNIASICDTFLRISRNECPNPVIRSAYILCVDCLVTVSEKLRAQIAASVCEYVISNFREDSTDQLLLSRSIKLIISTIRGSADAKPVFLSKLVDQDYKNIMAYICDTFDPLGQALASEFLWRMLQLLQQRRSDTEIKSLFGEFSQLQQIRSTQFTEGIHNFLKSLNSQNKNIYNFNLKNLIVGGSTVTKTQWIYIGNEKIVLWITKDSEWKPKAKKPCDILILKREDIRGICQQDKYWCIVLDDHFDTLVECFTDEKKLIFFKPADKSEADSILKIIQSRFGTVNESSIIITPPKISKKKKSEPQKVAETPKPKLSEKEYKNPPPQTPNFFNANPPVTPSLGALNQQTGTSFMNDSSSWSFSASDIEEIKPKKVFDSENEEGRKVLDSDSEEERKTQKKKIEKVLDSSSDDEEEIKIQPKRVEKNTEVPKANDRKFKPIREKKQKESIFDIKKGSTPDKQSKRIEMINEEINSAKKLLSDKKEEKTKQKKSNTKKDFSKKKSKEVMKQKKTPKKLSKKEKAKKEEEEKKIIISDDEIESPSISDDDEFSDNYAPVISQSFDNTQVDDFDEDSLNDSNDEKIEPQKVTKNSEENVTPKTDKKEEVQKQIELATPKRTYAPQSWELEAFAELKNFGQSIRQKLNDKHNEINKVIESSTENAINDVCKFTTECEENLELMRANFDDASSATYNDIQNKQKMVKELGQQQKEHIEQMRKDCAVLKKRAAEMIKRFEQQKTQLLQNQEKHIALFREDIKSEVRTAVSQKRREFSKSKVQKLVNLLEEL